MTADDIIKYVFKKHKPYWKTICGIDREAFEEILGLQKGGLKIWEYFRLVNNHATPKSLLEHLCNQSILDKIAKKLNCQNIFLCVTEEEIDVLISKATLLTKSTGKIIIPDPSNKRLIKLDIIEEKIIRNMIQLIKDGSEHHIIYWQDHPLIGSSLLAYGAGMFLMEEGIKTYLMQPYSEITTTFFVGNQYSQTRPYELAYFELVEALNMTKNDTPAEILQSLKNNRSVLFILYAEHIPEESNSYCYIKELIKEARKNSDKFTGPVPIFIIGTNQTLFKTRHYYSSFHHTQNNLTPSRTISSTKANNERGNLFETQWRRFCELRNIKLSDDMGTRLRRAQQYYSADYDLVDSAGAIRMLAFFASNYNTYSYFDPTVGLKKLSNMDEDQIPIDIRLIIEDAIMQINSIPEGKRQSTSALRALRWCSTALYWLTEDTVKELGKGPIKTNVDYFKSAIEKIPQIVRSDIKTDTSNHTSNKDNNKKEVFKVDLTIRALIQEQWLLQSPQDRAQAHYIIAKRLFDSSNDKNLLGIEFPFEPNWGRSRIYFLSETIRHLMRSCENIKRECFISEFQHAFQEQFPNKPVAKFGGCNPYEVVNFCFGVIYWQLLNGNSRSNNIHNRKLSRQHGAYQLTGELLQLIGCGNLNVPHWALNPVYINRYLREVAYAQLDLGDLQSAISNFKKLIDLQQKHVTEIVDYKLDLVLALASNDKLTEAESLLNEVQTASAHETLTVDSHSTSKNSDCHEERRKHQRINTRIKARKAHLFYLQGNIDSALEIYESLEKSNNETTISRDTAHVYIATLGSFTEKGKINKAMSICIKNLFENTSRGLHHEALGFRISLGHLYRKLEMLDVAETTLDQVYKDILQYGCSERTYISFLIEAGRIVFTQKRYLRAYAAYFRPCFNRAMSRGYIRTAQIAFKHATECLSYLHSYINEANQDGINSNQELVVNGRGDYFNSTRNSLIDPLYTYDICPIDSMKDCTERLQTKEGIDYELSELNASFSGFKMPLVHE